MDLYKANVVCRTCKITPRMLDYWITTGVIQPSATYQGPARKRDFFLFSFEDLVRIRIVRSLRAAGVSLQRVRVALTKLRTRRGAAWQAEWLVTNGKDVFAVVDDNVLESLAARGGGQLAFSLIAIGETKRQVATALKKTDSPTFRAENYSGTVTAFAAASIG